MKELKTAEEILSAHTGATGIYLTHGEVRGSDALEAMEEYSNQMNNHLYQKCEMLKDEVRHLLGMLRDNGKIFNQPTQCEQALVMGSCQHAFLEQTTFTVPPSEIKERQCYKCGQWISVGNLP